jgi:hypothetical protein
MPWPDVKISRARILVHRLTLLIRALRDSVPLLWRDYVQKKGGLPGHLQITDKVLVFGAAEAAHLSNVSLIESPRIRLAYRPADAPAAVIPAMCMPSIRASTCSMLDPVSVQAST